MTSAELRREAQWWGRQARVAYTFHADWAYGAARQAAHYATLYLEQVRIARAPLERVLANKVAQQRRQAETPRCRCRGKLAVKKRAGTVVAVECRACGRRLPILPANTPMVEGVAPITSEQWDAIDAWVNTNVE